VTVTFETTTSIAAPPAVVFDLSLSIDTHLDSQASARERAIGGVTTGQIGLGETVTWRATHFHISFTMTSRVTELDRPHRFVDEQTHGPFRRFHHEHEFLNPQRWNLISDERFDEFTGLVDAEDLYLAASHAYRCADCGSLWIFWDGHESDPVEYVPMSGRTDTPE
jgi:ligand-binding SRPBCC domain-containing protein